MNQSDAGNPGAPAEVLVWDLPVRLFHWALVVTVLTAWATGGSGHSIHEILGYVVAALIAFRIFWGFVGTRHARFTDFVKRPKDVWAYLFSALRHRAPRHVGHNPAGGIMIVLVLVLLAVIVISGIMQLTSRFFGVPWVEELHRYATNVLLVLIPFHLAGVVFTSWSHRENLTAAMLTGRKADFLQAGVQLSAAGERLLLDRIRGCEGFVVLAVCVAGGAFYGWATTSQRASIADGERQRLAAVKTGTIAREAETADAEQSIEEPRAPITPIRADTTCRNWCAPRQLAQCVAGGAFCGWTTTSLQTSIADVDQQRLAGIKIGTVASEAETADPGQSIDGPRKQSTPTPPEAGCGTHCTPGRLAQAQKATTTRDAGLLKNTKGLPPKRTRPRPGNSPRWTRSADTSPFAKIVEALDQAATMFRPPARAAR